MDDKNIIISNNMLCNWVKKAMLADILLEQNKLGYTENNGLLVTHFNIIT